jgi:tetratricopeptide (TPR) repeat protein
MSSTLLDDLKEEYRKRNAIFVVGAGVSIMATGNAACASWTGLLHDGAQRCVDLFPDLPPGWMERVRGEIDSNDLDDMLSAAEKISSKIGSPKGGEWRRWLRESVGELKPKDPKILEALRDLDAPLATTNYDNLISDVTKLPPVKWTEGSRVERVLRGDEKGILHLHGHWEQCESVILGIRSYEQVLGDAHAQTVLRSLAMFRTIVFVGFGAGLGDPNFGAFLKWTGKTFESSEYRRFRLALRSEVSTLQAQHPREQRLFVISYGIKHADLVPFLRSLRSGSVIPKPMTYESQADVRLGRAHIPSAPRCFGRDSEVAEVVRAVLASPPVPVPVLGGPGMGKSTVTLAALHDAGVVQRYGQRRFFVRCESAQSRHELVVAIAGALGVQPTSDIEPLVLTLLDGEPTLLVLDNLETPWEADTLGVEDFLCLLSACRNVALVVSIRGEERPSGVAWHDGIRLFPLQPSAARDAFISIAGKRFENDPLLNKICGAVEGIPLAITLLAHAAEAEPNLEGIWQRWDKKRTAMLRRAGGMHRLTNLEASYELSIHGLRMTQTSFRLLSVAALLPDGIAHGCIGDIFPADPSAVSILRKTGLTFDEANRLRILSPLREYMTSQYPPNITDRQTLSHYYIELVLQNANKVGGTGGAEAVALLSPEAANIEAILFVALRDTSSTESIDAACHWGEFVRFSGIGSGRSLELAADIAGSLEDIPRKANCIQSLGDIALERSDHDAARTQYRKALQLYENIPEPYSIAMTHRRLARLASNKKERERHVEIARTALTSINRPDLVDQINREFGEGSS